MNYPPPDLKKLLDHRKMAHKISEKVIASRLASLKCDGPPENDLFSVLGEYPCCVEYVRSVHYLQ